MSHFLKDFLFLGFIVWQSYEEVGVSQVKKEFAISLVSDWAVAEGFVKGRSDFVRKRGDFIDCISVQVSENGDNVALNVGAHPVFLSDTDLWTVGALHEFSEIDCYIRNRLALGGEPDFWISLGLDGAVLEADLKTLLDVAGAAFFKQISSVNFLVKSLTIENISSRLLPDCFGVITKSRLALLGVRANMTVGDVVTAREIAEYGLSICGMAVALKRDFKKLLSCL